MELTKIEEQKILMERKGLTVKTLAEAIGVDLTTLHRYFNDVMTRKSAKGYYSDKIDTFLSGAQKRVNPEIQGGGE